MSKSNRVLMFLVMAATGLATQACAAGSDAFRQMSAQQHEQVASNPGAPNPSGASADDHLAVARRLRDQEQSACANVPATERDLGPLARREVSGVQTLRDRPNEKTMLQPAGVAVYLRASPGLTEQWLGRVLECHLAHHAVVGDQVPDRDSPLFVDDARIALSSTGDGFRIAITTRDVSAAREIIEKAHALLQ